MKGILGFAAWNLVLLFLWIFGIRAGFYALIFTWVLWLAQFVLFRFTKSFAKVFVKTYEVIPVLQDKIIKLEIKGKGEFFKGILVCKNTLTKEENKIPLRGIALRNGQTFDLSVNFKRCGRIEFSFEKFRVYDLFVTSYKNLKPDIKGYCLSVSDGDYPELPEFNYASESFSTTENHIILPLYERNDFVGIREYEPGDSFKDIHWKISYRLGDIYMKEYSTEAANKLCLFMEAYCDGNKLALADTAQAICCYSARLCEMGVSHYVIVKNGKIGDFTVDLVENDDGFYVARGHILSCFPDEKTKTLSGISKLVDRYHISQVIYFANKGILPENTEFVTQSIYC